MKKPWFDNFKPISWEGWLSYLTFMFVAVWDYMAVDSTSDSFGDTLFFFLPHLGGMFLLMAIIIKARRIGNGR